MANLIDQTFFVREVLVPGAENALISQPLCQFVSEYEPVMLKKALGYSFYLEFIAALEESPSDGKWFDLLFGADFTYNGVLYKWEGLKSKSGELKRSIIANYVYYYYTKNNHTQSASLGEVATNTENSAKVSPGIKMERAWNKMIDQVKIMWLFLRYKTDEDGELVYDTFDYNAVEKTHFRPVFSMGI